MEKGTGTEKKRFVLNDVLSSSAQTGKSLGIAYLIFLVLFGVARDYAFVPLLGKLWGLVVSTTPDGFISNVNVMSAILKSPWVIPAGLVLIVLYGILSVWQVNAIVLGIGYAHEGKKIRLIDLLRLSCARLKPELKAKNWMILVYSLVILPLANVYQTGDFASAFIVPEYIQDFINVNPVLSILFVALLLLLAYIALRWMFLMPAFVLKNKSFREAARESSALTKGNWFRYGVNLLVYYIIELVKRCLIPMVIIMLPVCIAWLCTSKLNYSAGLFNTIGISWGWSTVASLSGSLLQISVMCFLVELWLDRTEKTGIDLEPLPTVSRRRMSTKGFTIAVSGILSVILVALYLSTVLVAQSDSSVILELFGETKIIAHKGYSSAAPENTMPAFEKADQSENTDYIELDVWSSKDGVPVVIHNSSIKDATGVDKLIYECTVAELAELPAPYGMSSEEFPDARIPTLEEVIARYAGTTPLLIEIKGYSQDPLLPQKIVELMKKYGCEYTCLIHSGDYGAISAVKAIDPDIQCGLILAMVTGNYYDLPNADFFSVEHTFVSRNMVSQVHRHGKQVFVWTVNYAESADALRFTGADALITDYPDDISVYVSDTNSLVGNVFENELTSIVGGRESTVGSEKEDY